MDKMNRGRVSAITEEIRIVGHEKHTGLKLDDDDEANTFKHHANLPVDKFSKFS